MFMGIPFSSFAKLEKIQGLNNIYVYGDMGAEGCVLHVPGPPRFLGFSRLQLVRFATSAGEHTPP